MSKNVMMNSVAKKMFGMDAEVSNITIRIIKKRTCKGIVVAFRFDDNVYIGHSLCKTGGFDKDIFCREKAYMIAMNRAVDTFQDDAMVIPDSIAVEYEKLLSRAYRYFKFEQVEADGSKSYRFPAWYTSFVEETPEFVALAKSKKEAVA